MISGIWLAGLKPWFCHVSSWVALDKLLKLIFGYLICKMDAKQYLSSRLQGFNKLISKAWDLKPDAFNKWAIMVKILKCRKCIISIHSIAWTLYDSSKNLITGCI